MARKFLLLGFGRPSFGQLLAFLCLNILGCAAVNAASGPTLLRGNGSEPDSFDPQRARTNEAFVIQRDLYEGLTSIGKDGSVSPGVATRWLVSEDGKTYTFKFRDNARWSNGDRVVARDFVAALRRLVDPATGAEYAQLLDVVVNARDIAAGRRPPESIGVSAPDDSTLTISLISPAGYLPHLFSHPSTFPVHPANLTKSGVGSFKPKTLVSNGAFTLQEWVPGSHVSVSRNPHYWAKEGVQLSGVIYIHIPDEAAEFVRYRAGELHITTAIPRAQLEWINHNIASELKVSAFFATYFYGFNLERAPFKDNPKLRQALSMVIDRERLAQSVLRLGEIPAYGWVPPGIPGYPNQSFAYRTLSAQQRLKEARRLYAQSGYSAEKPLKIELRYNTAEIHTRLAIAVSSMWKEALGVQTTLVAAELKSLLADIDSGQVELFRSSWAGDYIDPYAFAQYFKSDSGVNMPRYRSATYDALLNKAVGQSEQKIRYDLLSQAEQLLLVEHPIIPLYYYVSKNLVKPEVSGWYSNVMNVVYSKDLRLNELEAIKH